MRVYTCTNREINILRTVIFSSVNFFYSHGRCHTKNDIPAMVQTWEHRVVKDVSCLCGSMIPSAARWDVMSRQTPNVGVKVMPAQDRKQSSAVRSAEHPTWPVATGYSVFLFGIHAALVSNVIFTPVAYKFPPCNLDSAGNENPTFESIML